MRAGLGSQDELDAATRASVIAAWLALGAWTTLVWWLGGGEFAAPETSRILGPLIRWLWPEGSPEQHLAVLTAIRKLAHPSIYAVLAALAFRAVRVSGLRRPLHAAGAALLFAVAVAGLDEMRQSDLDSRTGSALDVALDASGAATALALLTAWVRHRARRLEGA